MALPKRKTSKAKGRSRRAHQAVVAPNVIKCPSCGEPRLPHRMCAHCGKYNDRVVKEIVEE